MKGIWVGTQSFVILLSTVAVVLAEEGKAGGSSYLGYEGIYLLWKSLVTLILIWGVYDSFFRPIDPPGGW